MWSRAAVALAGLSFGASGCASPAQLTVMERGRPNEVSSVSTGALPDGISLSVSHSVFHIGDAEGRREDSHNAIGYEFHFPSGRVVSAFAALDPFAAKADVVCRSAGAGPNVMLSQCSSWPEFRQALLTLYALDYHFISALGDAGYVDVKPADYRISDSDIDAWVAKCTEASRKVSQ